MLDRMTRAGRLYLAVLAMTLVVFGALVGTLTYVLRGQLRDGVLRREAAAVDAVAQLQIASSGMFMSTVGVDDPLADLFAAVLESSRLHGVLAVQVFDGDGRLRHALPPAGEADVAPGWWAAKLERPTARFQPQGDLQAAIGPAEAADDKPLPLLEVIVPLRPDRDAAPLGSARYWIDGAAIAAEFAQMNRALLAQAGIATAGGALLLALVLGWAYSRITDANRRLAQQSADLARANQELAFAAKTGAIGAISAHLIHGLKNPLSGLEGFVLESAGTVSGPVNGEAWQTAVDTTRRLRELVNEVVVLLREESGAPLGYQVPVREIVEASVSRNQEAARRAGVEIAVTAAPAVDLPGRAANLAGLVLVNLIANAIDASPRGQRVHVDVHAERESVIFLVRDAGTGVPAAVQSGLFQPVRSTKPGGGGIGLAISRQLARHAGGDLELQASTAQGAVFRLWLPLA